MKKSLRILYIKDPTSVDKREDFVLEKFNLRVVSAREDLIPASVGFLPHILLCSLKSPISTQEVLDILDVSEKNAPVIITLPGDDLHKVLPLIEATNSQYLQDKRQEIEERHSSAYHKSIDGILVTKPDGTIIAANPAACEMLEMTEEEICKAGRAGIVDPEDHRLSYAIDQREKFGNARTELTFIKKGGEKFLVDLTSSVFKNVHGNLITIVLLRDITQKKQVEERLRISDDSYKTLFNYSPIPYWIYDQNTFEILDVNEIALEDYGYTREEFLNLTLKDLRPKEEIPHLWQHISDKSGNNGAYRRGKFTHIRKDGSHIKVEIYGYQLNYSNRNCRLVACIDITEKEEARNQMEIKRARLAAAQEIANLGYWEYNSTTQTFFLSEMMCRIWGREVANFKPSWSCFEETVHPDDRDKFKQAQQDSIYGSKEHNLEYRILQPSGEIKWIHELGRVLTWNENVPQTVERTVQDITEGKNYLEKLATSEARYKGILQSQTNYLIRTDMEGNYTHFNHKFYADFGWLYKDSEILGQPSLSSIMEYHHQPVIDVVERCVMAPGTAIQIEIDKPTKDNGIRTTLWDFICLVDARGIPAEIQCVGIDISARVKAEKDLMDSKLRYQLITEATSDVIWDLDLTSGRLTWGRSFLTLFGHNPDDVQTIDSGRNLVHSDDLSTVIKGLTAAIEGEDNKWISNFRFKKKNGEYAHIIEKGSIIRDENKRAYRLVGAIQDVTEKKKLEDLLEKANSLARIGSFEVDVLSKVVYWSPMTKEIHEVKENFIPTIEKMMAFPKEEKHKNTVKEIIRKASEENKIFNEEIEIRTAGGKDLWVKIIGEPEIEDGKCIKITGSLQDIDKIKRAEIEVKNAAQEKEILLESIGDAFFAVDEDWKVTYWNKHAATLLNCPREAILQKNVWDVFPDAVGTSFQHNYEASLQDGKKRRFEAFYEKVSSWLDVAVYPTDEGLSVFFKDITQRKTAEVRLKELNTSLRAYTRELVTANKGLEQFSYIVSHNLRSPVANILGLADLLQNEDYPPQVKENLYREVFSNVERLDSVIKDLNSILKVKVDIRAQREKIDLNELVTTISSSIQNLLGDEQAEIICNFGDTGQITSVRSYLYSIFYNLIINSIKYRRPNVALVLKITGETNRDATILYFEDNGLGIDLSKSEEHIFGLYKRFHHHVEGKGMGLFMVKTQVEMLGGKISVQSEVNKGTTFTIIFKEN